MGSTWSTPRALAHGALTRSTHSPTPGAPWQFQRELESPPCSHAFLNVLSRAVKHWSTQEGHVALVENAAHGKLPDVELAPPACAHHPSPTLLPRLVPCMAALRCHECLAQPLQ